MSGPGRTGRLDRLGPVAAGVRGVAGAARTGASAVSRRVRRTLREPAALRDARRAELTELARSAVSGPAGAAVGPAATPALDAAVTAWLADPGPVTGALLRQVQGRYRATRDGDAPDLAAAGVPLDEAHRLTALLAPAGAARTGRVPS